MRGPALVALNCALLLVLALVIVAGKAGDRASPAVEAAVERYARAMAAQDLERALAEIAPDQRQRWRPWVAEQLGNIYDVRGIGVRTPSLLGSLTRGQPREPVEATVVLDVNRGYPDFFYQPTTRVAVARVDDRWYLVEPLLAPEAVTAGDSGHQGLSGAAHGSTAPQLEAGASPPEARLP